MLLGRSLQSDASEALPAIGSEGVDAAASFEGDVEARRCAPARGVGRPSGDPEPRAGCAESVLLRHARANRAWAASSLRSTAPGTDRPVVFRCPVLAPQGRIDLSQ